MSDIPLFYQLTANHPYAWSRESGQTARNKIVSQLPRVCLWLQEVGVT